LFFFNFFLQKDDTVVCSDESAFIEATDLFIPNANITWYQKVCHPWHRLKSYNTLKYTPF